MLHAAKRQITSRTKHPLIIGSLKTAAVIFGAVLVAAGLELFLIPNGFLDGGVVGISILLTNFISIPVGVFIGVLNIPFLFIAYRHSGIKTAFRTALGIAVLAFATVLFHYLEPVTDEYFLALVSGGALVGAGVGVALRFGGALDGTEILAVYLATRTRFSVDQIILGINVIIFTVAAFILSWEAALSSFFLFYLVVTRIIRQVMQGGTELKMLEIVSKNHQAVAEVVHKELNRKVLFIDAHRDDVTDVTKVVKTYCARVEEAALVEAIEEVDPDAIIIVTDAANVHGSVFANNKHH